jgi:hypothetical protein
MSVNERRLRDALAKIAEVASAAVKGDSHDHDDYDREGSGGSPAEPRLVCTPKSLPKRLLVKAAKTATRINPVNAPALGTAAAGEGLQVSDPLQIAVLTSKYWGASSRQLTVSFMEPTPADLRARIVSHLNAWNATAGISFVETFGIGQVRISRGSGGYFSYLGTDVLLIPTNRQTMNLEGFTMNTPESEYRRVVRHEAGHTLGFPHEHMRQALVSRIDPIKAYAYFLATQGWNKATVDAQVLTPLSEATLMSTPADQTSIMCYQLPGQITFDGQPILGGLDINVTDFAFAAAIYPKFGFDPTTPTYAEDWPEAEDVPVAV